MNNDSETIKWIVDISGSQEGGRCGHLAILFYTPATNYKHRQKAQLNRRLTVSNTPCFVVGFTPINNVIVDVC